RRIERRRKPRRAMTLREIVKATVRPLRSAFSGEHAHRILFFSAVRIDAARIREAAWKVLRQNEAEDLAPFAELGRTHFWNRIAGERTRVVLSRDRPASNHIGVLGSSHLVETLRPPPQLLEILVPDRLQCAVVLGS